jgi:fatty-acyl-CoA synthase
MMGSPVRTDIVWKALAEVVEAVHRRRGYVYLGREISFKEIDDISDRVASGFLKAGINKGDRVGIICPNQPEWLHTYFAVAKIGAVLLGLDVRYRAAEFEYMVNQSGAKALVTIAQSDDMDYRSFFEDFRTRIPTVEFFFFIGEGGFPGSHRFETLLNTPADKYALENAKAAVKPDDLIMIIYTSGTTGKPKGAALTHKSQMAAAIAQAEHTRTTKEDLILLALPFMHVGGITCGILNFLVGKGTCVLIPGFSKEAVIEHAIKYKPTVFAGVPTTHALCMMDKRFQEWDSRDQVRLLISGGANSEPELLRKLLAAFPNAAMMNLYGLSETSGAAIMSTWDSDFETSARSIGKPIGGGQVRIVDLDGNDLASGETGELWIKSDSVVAGYYGMPEETELSFDCGGWLHTGDMGYMDRQGHITLVGRKKEMYIQGGYNVYPVEVENLLLKHPKVLFAAGIGVPDAILGEVGRYYIVPKPGAAITEDEIKEYCARNIADYKIPRQIVFRNELPLTPLHKVKKSVLKEIYEKTGT